VGSEHGQRHAADPSGAQIDPGAADQAVMEGQQVDALATIRPDVGFLRAVRALAVAAAAGAVTIVVLLAVAEIAVGPLVLVLLPFCVVAATLSRGNVAEARVTRSGLDIVGHDGVVRSIPGPAIGGMGISGPVVAGRLVAVPLGFVPSTIGRIVVVDHQGRVICARRAGWMAVADIHTLAAAGGVAWLGPVRRQVPGVSLPPPPGMEAPLPLAAREDPATVAALGRIRGRTRRLWLWLIGWFVTGIGSLYLLEALPDGHGLRPLLGWYGGLGIVALIFGAPLLALYGEHARWARRNLRSGHQWWPVEAVVVAGLVTDASARVVGVVDPATGATVWWTVEEGGEQGWLQGDDRTWFWFLIGKRQKKALIAPPDRSDIAVLERTLLGRIVTAEADAQVRAEAMEWQARQTWAAHAAHHGQGR
jgi:hypothetical protein